MQQWWGGLFQRPLLLGEVCLLGLQLHTRREVSQEAFRRTCTHSSLRVRVGTSPYSSVAGELSLGRRSYAEKVYRKQLKATTENSAAEEKSKRRRVKARKTSRPKSDNLSINSPKDSKVVGIELDFPFEGTLNKPQASREQLTSNRLQHSNGDTLTTHIGMVTAAGSDARTYDIHRNGRVFQLPSVTTVLSHTLPKQRGFMLSHWRKGLVREFGEEGYQQVRNKIIHLGSKFHAVSCCTCTCICMCIAHTFNHCPLGLNYYFTCTYMYIVYVHVMMETHFLLHAKKNTQVISCNFCFESPV